MYDGSRVQSNLQNIYDTVIVANKTNLSNITIIKLLSLYENHNCYNNLTYYISTSVMTDKLRGN